MTPFAAWRSRLPAAISSWFARDITRAALDYIERGSVTLRAVEDARIEGEVKGPNNGVAWTSVAEWIGGTGPLALRCLCSCGVSGICEHVVATLETVRTSTEAPGENLHLEWLPVAAPAPTRRARSIWIIFSPADNGAFGATLVLDSPRLRGVQRDAQAIVAMLDSTPADDWDEADRRLLRDDGVLEAFAEKRQAKALARAMLRLVAHPRLRFDNDPMLNRHPSELGDFSVDLRGLRLAVAVAENGFAPIVKSRDNERIDPAKLFVLEGPPKWAATTRTAFLLDDSFDLDVVRQTAKARIRSPINPTTIARVAPYLTKNDRNELGVVDAEKPSVEVALAWSEGALVASVTFVDRASKEKVPFHRNGALAQAGDKRLFFLEDGRRSHRSALYPSGLRTARFRPLRTSRCRARCDVYTRNLAELGRLRSPRRSYA